MVLFLCRSLFRQKNGILFIAPDFFKETFKPSTSHGGHDGEKRSLRYLEWCYDDNPNDNIVETRFAYILKDKYGKITVEQDYTVNGIFSKKTWQDLLKQAGFKVYFEEINHSELEPVSYIGIVGVKQ